MNFTTLSSWVLYVIIAIVSLVTFTTIITLLTSIKRYFDAKMIETSVGVKHTEKSHIAFQLDNTRLLLDMIDDMIMTEIGSVLHRLLVLNQEYPILRLDNDVKEMAESVYSAFKKDAFVSEDLCLTDEYVLKYITERTKTLALNSVYEYNQSLYARKNMGMDIMGDE